MYQFNKLHNYVNFSKKTSVYQELFSVEVKAINSKIARRYALIMIYKPFNKHEARAENYNYSHCYASCDPQKTIINIIP